MEHLFPPSLQSKRTLCTLMTLKPSYKRPRSQSSYLKQTTNTTISEVAISLSAGAGLLEINIIGRSNISQSIFHHNKPNCLIIFLDLPSISPSTALDIEDSYLAFGMPPNHSKKVEWSATGLCIVLTQIAYRVHIYASNVTIYNNLKWLITAW